VNGSLAIHDNTLTVNGNVVVSNVTTIGADNTGTLNIIGSSCSTPATLTGAGFFGLPPSPAGLTLTVNVTNVDTTGFTGVAVNGTVTVNGTGTARTGTTNSIAYNITQCVVPPPIAIGSATLDTSAGNITGQAAKTPTDAVALCNNVPLPSGYTFPYGAFVYGVAGLPNGGTTNMTLTLPDTLPVGSKIFKCNSANQWVELTNTSDNGDAIINFTLKDGETNTDHDGAANGTIADPAVPAVVATVGGVAEIISVPTTSTSGLGYLAGLASVVMLVGVAWLVSRRG
jgi:hypothetical protein